MGVFFGLLGILLGCFMADVLQQTLFERQRELEAVNRNVEALTERIWAEIRRLTSLEAYDCIRRNTDSRPGVTKLEVLDNIFGELQDIWVTRDEHRQSKLEEFATEIRFLKGNILQLKSDLRGAFEEAEELERENHLLKSERRGSRLLELGEKDIIYENIEDLRLQNISVDRNVKAKRNIPAGTQRVQERERQTGQQTEEGVEQQAIQSAQREQEGEQRIEQEAEERTGQQALQGAQVNFSGNRTMSEMEFLKKIPLLVPMFGGESSVNLQTEVYKFIDGVRMASEGVAGDAESVGKFLKLVKLRLSGDAYQLVMLRSFNSVEDFLTLIKNTYLKVVSHDSVMREISTASQRQGEDLRQYARRLESLAATAGAILKAKYGNEADAAVVRCEMSTKIRDSFISGLTDQIIRTRLLSSSATDLDGLLKEALGAQATLWRGDEPPRSRICFVDQGSTGDESFSSLVAAVQQVLKSPRESSPAKVSNGPISADNQEMRNRFPPCAFCKKQGHNWANCWERMNTPYCEWCEVYGHVHGRSCDQGPRAPEYSNERFDGSRNRSSIGQGAGQVVFRNTNRPGQDHNRSDSNNRWNNDNQQGTRNENQGAQGSQRNLGYFASRQGQGSAETGHSQGSRGGGPIRCFNCGGQGHISRECRSPRVRSGNGSFPQRNQQ